jgi:hypothetical protein
LEERKVGFEFCYIRGQTVAGFGFECEKEITKQEMRMRWSGSVTFCFKAH